METVMDAGYWAIVASVAWILLLTGGFLYVVFGN
jgi:hypothetical protein